MIKTIFLCFGFIGLTIILFLVAKEVYKRVPNPLLLPMVTTSTAIIVILILFQIDYETYMLGGSFINHLLGPAVVALAYPLYQQRDILKRLFVPVVFGSLTGSIVGVSTGVLLTKWFGFPKELIYSITPKSVTTPIAMDITAELDGYVALAAVFVTIAGVSGAMFGHYVQKKVSTFILPSEKVLVWEVVHMELEQVAHWRTVN